MGEASRYTNATTPLVISCLNGFLDIASHLIEECHVDLNEGGIVIIENETAFDASPLWCAAANGHLKLVKLLLRCGASVHKSTTTNSTPFRAACFNGCFEIVKLLIAHGADIEIENVQGNTPLMIACYKKHYEIVKYLLERRADVNRTNKYCLSSLNYAAESGDLNIVQLLLKHGAKNPTDASSMTPLLSAANKGKQEVVEYFMASNYCSKEEKINALELLGATLMDEKQDMAMALKCWRKAMQLRYENSECPLVKDITTSRLGAYLNETEVSTVAAIEALMSDPDTKKVEIQALLMRERILGMYHVDNIYYIKLRGGRHADNDSLQTCLKLWAYLFVVQQEKKPFSKVTYDILSDISELRCDISNNSSCVGKFHNFFSDILLVFEIAVKEIKVAIELSQNQDHDLNTSTQFLQTIIYAMDLLSFMYEMQPQLNETQKSKLENAVPELIHINPTIKNASVLQFLTCFKRLDFLKYPMISFPSSELIDHVLKVDAIQNKK